MYTPRHIFTTYIQTSEREGCTPDIDHIKVTETFEAAAASAIKREKPNKTEWYDELFSEAFNVNPRNLAKAFTVEMK